MSTNQEQIRHRLCMAWGGSWGHIFPIVSMIDYIDTYHHADINSIMRIGQAWSMEEKIYNQYRHKRHHIDTAFHTIYAGKYRRETIRRSWIKNIRDVFLFGWWILQSIYILSRHKIDTIFCKGWFVALPVVIAWWILRITIIMHDSDTWAWLTSRIASRFAQTIYTWFPDTLPWCIPIGQILSDDIIVSSDTIYTQPIVQTIQQKIKNLPSDIKIILISGWSLWSQTLYHHVAQAIMSDHSLQNWYFFVCINGSLWSDYFVWLDNVLCTDFIDQQTAGYLYSIADRCIMRAGTTSLTEAKLYNIPLIMVPLPVTHDQKTNAAYYTQTYMDITCLQCPHLYLDLIPHIKQTIKKTLTYPNVIDIHAAKKSIYTSLVS
jgi:UDP-N-acetylglucosamine:LPS N-acetylglucosamine transferase